MNTHHYDAVGPWNHGQASRAALTTQRRHETTSYRRHRRWIHRRTESRLRWSGFAFFASTRAVLLSSIRPQMPFPILGRLPLAVVILDGAQSGSCAFIPVAVHRQATRSTHSSWPGVVAPGLQHSVADIALIASATVCYNTGQFVG